MKPIALVLGMAAGLGQATPPARKTIIAVAVLGDAPRAFVDELTPILGATFSAEIVAAPGLALPPSSWNAGRRQYLSTSLLEALAAIRRPEWERLIGLAEEDLYAPDLNFVFGEADSQRGVAVFSLARLRAGADEALLARRAATEAVHELGHTYGLSHCNKPTCVMWFSNTLSESDRKGTRFCPAHARELAEKRSR
jgi:archaemetzincin